MADHLETICKFCEKRSHYTCPRCSARYCSSSCYKAPEHTSCSETFYETQVKQTMKQLRPTPESRQQVQAMLRRLEDQDDLCPQQFCQQWDERDGVEEEDELDSDDEEDIATRLKGIDLDDSDAVWARLTDAERQSFREMVQTGDVTKILPDYTPWWEVAANNQGPGIVELSEEEAISFKNNAGTGPKGLQQDDRLRPESNPNVEHLAEHEVSGELTKGGGGETNSGNDKKIKHCIREKEEGNCNKAGSSHGGIDHQKNQILANAKKSRLQKNSSNILKSVTSQEQKSLLSFFENIPAALKDKYNHGPKPAGIKPLDSLISCPPSPLVRYSLLNTAASYAWLLRLFHGDHHANHGEAAETVLSLSAALANQARLDSVDQALSSIHMRAIQHEWLCPSDTLMQTVATDAFTLLTGPSDLPGYYLHCALADLQTVLRACLRDPEANCTRDRGSDSFLSSLQGAQQTIPRTLTTPKLIRLALKKLDFFLSYAFSFRLQIREEFLPLI